MSNNLIFSSLHHMGHTGDDKILTLNICVSLLPYALPIQYWFLILGGLFFLGNTFHRSQQQEVKRMCEKKSVKWEGV